MTSRNGEKGDACHLFNLNVSQRYFSTHDLDYKKLLKPQRIIIFSKFCEPNARRKLNFERNNVPGSGWRNLKNCGEELPFGGFYYWKVGFSDELLQPSLTGSPCSVETLDEGRRNVTVTTSGKSFRTVDHIQHHNTVTLFTLSTLLDGYCY